VTAAEARVLEAERNLERTRITAPYDGRVLAKNVDLGQVVGQGTVLAKVYAVDYAEIRLPLTSNEYAYLDMRPVVRGQTVRQDELPAAFYAKFGPVEVSWEGRIVRVEGARPILSPSRWGSLSKPKFKEPSWRMSTSSPGPRSGRPAISSPWMRRTVSIAKRSTPSGWMPR
jgi:pyruvate/2-oxoglutarate dehydrogenase complex dihydrolipoamide acyltransferase (E2) component